ncbi:MAG TPA: hypothetical protein VF331_20385 [Polyangiales bacterium]
MSEQNPSRALLHSASLLVIIQALCATLPSSGCDSQTGVAYQGAPLLQVSGSVSIEPNAAKGPLIPALAFENGQGLDFTEVEVSGKFPADFTISVFDPPSASALRAWSAFEDEPKMAFGYITAVSATHPAHVALVHEGSSGSSCADPGAAGHGGGDAGSQAQCTQSSWCTWDQSQCYMETTTCPDAQSPPPACTTTHSGDPALKNSSRDYFAGRSSNYLVVNLAAPAKANSWLAYWLGSSAEMSAGYHLIAATQVTDAERPAAEECETRANGLAAERYNAKYGTALTVASFSAAYCGPSSEPCANAHDAELARYEFRAEADLNCPPYSLKLTPVADPAHAHIEVLIGPDPNGL